MKKKFLQGIFMLFFSFGYCSGGKLTWQFDTQGKMQLVNEEGKIISEYVYDQADVFFDFVDFVSVQRKGRYGAINRYGKEFVPCKYDYVGDCYSMDVIRNETFSGQDCYVVCKLHRKRRCISFLFDKEGNLLLKNKNGGFINLLKGYIICLGRKANKVVSLRDGDNFYIDKTYEVYPFEENGLAMVVKKLNDTTSKYVYGAINTKGVFVMPCVFKSGEELKKEIDKSDNRLK